MKIWVAFFLISAFSTSCVSRKINNENLPKDVSLKPKDSTISDTLLAISPIEHPKNTDENTLQALRNEIDELISKTSCNNPNEWRISPMGAKACGGPERYIAYPISIESVILDKIDDYTHHQDQYNKENHIMSDCAMVLPPSGIICIEGKAVFTTENH